MAEKVAGDLYYELDGQLSEIKRQLRQPNGYPFDPYQLKAHLQAGIEGRFVKFTLLNSLRTISAPACKKFVAADHVKKTNIGWMSGAFKEHLLPKIEEDVPATELVISELTRESPNAPIREELGDKAEVPLAHFFYLLPQLKSCWLLGFCTDVSGTLWAVGAGWDASDGSWYVGALSVENPDGWCAGGRVFSRK